MMLDLLIEVGLRADLDVSPNQGLQMEGPPLAPVEEPRHKEICEQNKSLVSVAS